MKTYFGFPGMDYNIVLTKEELDQLIQKEHVTVRVSRTPCFTDRLVYREQEKKMEALDRKEIYNGLSFRTEEKVADMNPDIYSVQFLRICLQKGDDQ